jgi:hypothetical protein
MGDQSTIIVLHDALGEIARDKNFGEKLSSACLTSESRWRAPSGEITLRHRYPREASAGNFSAAATVITSHHADTTSIVLGGGCTAKLLGSTHNGGRFQSWPEIDRVIKTVLRPLGYRISVTKERPAVDVLGTALDERDARIERLEAEVERLRAELDAKAAR